MENYDIWDESIPPLPSRSRLYRLEPIGIGTPYVESLTSYIIRLAMEHCISPITLIRKVILPLHNQSQIDLAYLTQHYRLNKFWNCNAETLNSMSPIARQWTQTLEHLTSCNYLQYLTMLPWNEVLASRRLLRESRAWCPYCYKEWHESGQVVYEPLIWALRDVEICLNHKKDLIDICPYCQKTQTFLTQSSRPGYCSYCVCWLGVVSRQRDRKHILNNTENFKWQCWVSESIGILLSATPSLSVAPAKKYIALNIATLLDHYTDGNAKSFAKLLKMSPQQILNYVQGSCVPYVSSLLKICFFFSISPLDFLTRSTLPLEYIPRFDVKQIPVVSRGKRKLILEADVQHIRQVLEQILNVDSQVKSFPSLKEIAQRMGYDDDTLRRHCPDLYQKCKERYKRQWMDERTLTKLRCGLEEALGRVDRLSLVVVAQQLDCDVVVLRYHFPELCRVIAAKYRNRFNYEQMEESLRAALVLTSGKTPTIGELARALGCKRHNLWGKFPDLCKQIAVRCRTERSKQHQERVARGCEEIRRAMWMLHKQGIYPSMRQLFKIITDPYELRRVEGHETWVATLEELGYSTEKLKKH